MAILQLEKILDQASREYLLEGRERFTIPLRFTEEMRTNADLLEAEVKRTGFLEITGYRDVLEGFVKVGRPSAVTFTRESLLQRRPELAVIRLAWDEALSAVDDESGRARLWAFFSSNYSLCLKKADRLPACVRILEYLKSHRSAVRGLFPRQIPHAESSKLILNETILLDLYLDWRAAENPALSENERTWRGFFEYFGLRAKPYLFHYFSPEVRIDGMTVRNHHGLIHEASACRLRFASTPLLVVENEETFLALQETALGWNLIRGAGKAVALSGFLKESFAGPIYYWGDLDKDGYEIFAAVRDLFPSAQPLLMGEDVLTRYKHAVHRVSPQQPSPCEIPCGLRSAYEKVCVEGIRLEQEKIPLTELLIAAGEAG